MPSCVRLKGLTAVRKTTLTIDMYQWEYQRQHNYDRRNIPNYDGDPEDVLVVRYSQPDEGQHILIEEVNSNLKESIEQGEEGETVIHPYAMSLPSWYEDELDAKFILYILDRGDFSPLLLNRGTVKTTGIQGIPFLRCCKQALEEGAPILYGENRWVFDTIGRQPFAHKYGIHRHDELDRIPKNATHLIPGLPNSDGTPISQ